MPGDHFIMAQNFLEYLDENGLVGGRIPAGQPCNFYKICDVRMDRCPRAEKLSKRNFSCAAARLFSLIESRKKK